MMPNQLTVMFKKTQADRMSNESGIEMLATAEMSCV
jgi:hypothetical protein